MEATAQPLYRESRPLTERNNIELFNVTSDCEQDPTCARSMSLIRKWIIVIIISTGTVCVTCASSIYTTTYAGMEAEFGTSRLVSTIGLSVYVFGIALGPLLTSPLSEWHGRRPIYLVSWSMFAIWTIPSAVARNIETIIIARFFCGFAGGTFLSVSGGTVRDLFSGHDIQSPMALVSSAPFIGPCLGPLFGGFITSYAHWRWTYYFVIIWSVVLLVSIFIFAPETHASTRLRAVAKRTRKSTHQWKATVERSSQSKNRTLMISLLRPFQLLFLEPMCLCLNLYSAVLLGILYLFFGAFPLVFETQYSMSLWQVGLTFMGIITGMIAAAASAPVWSNIREHLLSTRTQGPEESPPEYRLPPAILGGVLIPVGLFWFGWTTYSNIHWIVPIMGSAIFGLGTLLAFMGIFTFLVDAYPQYAASALASNGFARCSFAAVFPLFGIQMFENLGYQWATSLLAFLTLAMMPFPWIFFIYGKALRERSSFAVDEK